MITKSVWKEIKKLWKLGYSQNQISSRLNLNKKTVKKYIKCENYPLFERAARRGKLEAYYSYIREQFKATKTFKGSKILEEIKKQGYTGSSTVLYSYIRKLKSPKDNLLTKKANVKTSKKLPKYNMSRHLSSYQEEELLTSLEAKMAGKRIENALPKFCDSIIIT